MPSTNQNAPQLNRHHSKHTLPSSEDFDFYIHTIGGSMRESMVVLDQDLRVHSVNRAFCELLQIDAVSAKGCPCYELGDSVLDTPEIRRLLEEVLLSVTTVDDFEVTRRLASGGVRRLLINARVIARENRSRFILLVIEEIQAERTLHAVRAELANEVRGLTRLNEASSVLWRTRDLLEGLREVMIATIDIMSADFGNIQLLDPHRQVLTIAAQQGFDQEFLEVFREVNVADACACGRALLARQRLVVEDVEVDEEYAPFREIARKSHYRAVQSTPLLGPQGQPLGMISTHWRLPHRPLQQELTRLDLFARQAAEFIWRGRMDQQFHEHEAFVISILDTAADAIITLNGQGLIVRVNTATERMFGYTAHELLGRNINSLTPAVSSGEFKEIRSQSSQPGSRRNSDIRQEFLGLRKCGSSFPLELSVSRVDHLEIFTIIVRDISDRCKLQREIVTIAEDEQRKIGQELHDSAQQELTAVSLLARVLLEYLKGNSADIPHANVNRCADIAEKIVAGVKRANEEVRQISHGLIPVQLDSKGLVTALQQLALQTNGLKSTACTFSSRTPVKITEAFTATHLFKIAQESVTNCLKHAHAKHIHIELEAEESAIVLRVSDDGIGFHEQPTRGVGLRSMEYRAHLINGILKLTNLDSGGALVTCTVFNGGSTQVNSSKSGLVSNIR